MKKYLLLSMMLLALAACDEKKQTNTEVQNTNTQQEAQIQTIPGQPVIINQAPASQGSDVMPLVGGMLLGHALSGNNNNSVHTRTVIRERTVYRPSYKSSNRSSFRSSRRK